ncbi:alpha-mannosidase [Bacillus canaveralius]|uniref:Alpha-mannosidase n=1 Tax=Bacillus canaveralius TaxID=1403243 RepID=A0A2N5GQ83_9BACI|nr:mannosylglycerate hydrolase [Bacillus canaveralius]PLR85042.1 alpha-mannosidase [Bacillus canaveralius]PLS00960.1 alpha-mannosidase [Bacillus canaveralius]RSK54174.1 mannosylglycerate hydrolase [Bacillus canaveralius]
MKKVHIVPHMHWDREWYFTTEESRILLVNNMEEILETLENDSDYPYYVLDGQTAILEDYFAVKPENKERVKKLVQEGKLIIGPWYTQTDEMIVGGESIVRNLLYGIKDSEQFGSYMKIGYLPDSFGQSSQMPQILKGFDIKYSIFWRGTSERHGTDKTEFYWEADDGSKVLVQLFPLGYAIGKYLPEDEEKLQERIDKYFTILDQGATTENIILPNGHDQMPIQKNISTIIEKLSKLYPDREFFLSRYENVFAEIEKSSDLPTLKGEFLDGKYMRVHRSIYSTRMDIKAANARIENKLANILEPLASVAYSLGFEYHHGLIELIWKEIMKNHAHDSIGCCCSDKVHQEIFNRFTLAEEKVDQLIEFYKRKIVDSIGTEWNYDRLTAFNFLPYVRDEVMTATVISKFHSFKLLNEEEEEIEFEVLKSEIIDPGLIDRQIVHYGNYDPFIKYTVQLRDSIPSLGYKTYFVVEDTRKKEPTLCSADSVCTDFFDITVNSNGSINIYDKKINQTFEQVLLLENGGDDGDEYDYSPLADEQLLYNDHVKAAIEITENRYTSFIDIQYTLAVPESLEHRKQKVVNSSVDVHIVLTVPKHKPIIEVKFEVVNHARDHRLRALIPTGIASAFSVADNQFGIIKRKVYDEAMEVWEEENWDERPDSIYPMLSFTGLRNQQHGVYILTNSTREYEIVGEEYDTIAITLFRSIGVLGKEELLRRPGRPSGIKLPTPDSQMLGKLTLDFAISIQKGADSEVNVGRLAKEYLTPIHLYNKIPYNAMKLNQAIVKTPVSFSLLKETNPQVVLSTLKKAEKDDRLVLRFYNPTDNTKLASFELGSSVEQAYKANLNEKPLESLILRENLVEIEAKSNQVQTILF